MIDAAAPGTDDPPARVHPAAQTTRRWASKRIGAADFATFTLDALERDGWIGHIVGVSAALFA